MHENVNCVVCMTKYDIPTWKMCYEAAKELPKVFTPIAIIRKVREKRPQVKENTIRAHVIGLAPNHPSYKHYGMRRRLFYYLGNGKYRLLSEKDRTPVPAAQKEISESGRVSGLSLRNADRLLSLGMYGQAIKEYGLIIEQLLRQLYEKYLPSLPVQYKEKIVSYEKQSKASITKFTLGQWIGLFRSAGLFKYISQDKKVKGGLLVFFNPAILDAINDLRNKSTHSTKDGALFMKSATRCIFKELED